MPDDWSKLSGAIFSRASDALNDAKQLKISMSQQDVSAIDWSKLSVTIVSRASGALNQAKQLKDSMPQQDMIETDWSKLSSAIVSSASDALNEVKHFGVATLFSEDSVFRVDMPRMDWSKLSNAFHAAKQSDFVSISLDWSFAMADTFHQQLRRLIEMSYDIPWFVKQWSITHPYAAAGGLLFTLGCINPVILLTPLKILQITGSVALRMCVLPIQILVRLLGFTSRGVMKGSLAALYQSRVLGGYVLRGSIFTALQSCGATIPSVKGTFFCLLVGTGFFFLGRNWGFWCN